VCAFPISTANSEYLVDSRHTGAMIAIHLKEVLDCFELTDGHVLRIMTNNAASNYSTTRHLQSTLEEPGIEWVEMRIHIPCMPHIIHLASCASRSSFSLNGHTKSWEAHKCNQQFGEIESTDIGKSQRLQKEGNARINNVSAMRLGQVMIIQKELNSRHFERPEHDHHIAENDSCSDYADTWLSKRVC
jgi:hypothetical protein